VRENINDLLAFLAVARERSFTRAAAQMGVSQSALSHTIRALESRLGLRLLTRTTRSVATTQAGERLLRTIGPRLREIEEELDALTELRDKPAGTLRITATDIAADTVLWPRLAKVLALYPDLKVEVVIDYGLTDIVADRFDIGVRFGDQVAKDMIAVRAAPDTKMAIVGSPAYLAGSTSPRLPADLTRHNCIALRLPTRGGLYAWELKKGRRELQVRVDGQFTCNGAYQMINAAIDGAGLAFVPDDLVAAHVAQGRLVRVMEDWCPTFPGYHIYYTSRREMSRAMAVVVDALRYRP
jgi:DNA-binding transcriptional LysR family regulator